MIVMLKLALFLAAALYVLFTVTDAQSTIDVEKRFPEHTTERNPLTRWLMAKLGPVPGVVVKTCIVELPFLVLFVVLGWSSWQAAILGTIVLVTWAGLQERATRMNAATISWLTNYGPQLTAVKNKSALDNFKKG